MKTYNEAIRQLAYQKRAAYLKNEPFNKNGIEIIAFVFNVPLLQVEHDVTEMFASGF